MSEVVGTFTGKKIGPTYFRGSKPIDGIWATTDVTVTPAYVMPVGYGIGDHCLFVVDVLINSLIGTDPVRIVRPQARRLNTKIPGTVAAYNQELESLVLRHRIVEHMQRAHESGQPAESAKATLNKIDTELKDYMLHAEKTCRKIKSGWILFSPEAEMWIRRSRIYRSLLRWQGGHKTNTGNLRRAVLRAGIRTPFELLSREIEIRLGVCQEHCEYFRTHGQQHRT